MKTMLSLLVLTLTLFASACSDDTVQMADGQDVYFEVSYMNMAWGKQFKGFLIDKDGKIRTYDKPAKWNSVTEKTELSAAQMKENVANTVVSDKVVSATELKENIAKANDAVSGTLSKPTSGGADRGTTSYYVYRFDAAKLTYVPILLSQTGDWEIANQNKSAVEISAWLSAILAKVY